MKQEYVELDRLRIWDFYMTFPNEASKITFPQDLIELKRVFKQRKQKDINPYENLIDPRKIIERMKPYQIYALKSIASYGFIDSDDFSKNIIRRTDKEIPKEILEKFEQTNDVEMNILKLVVGFSELPLFGKTGLKYRTGLIDFKYDPN